MIIGTGITITGTGLGTAEIIDVSPPGRSVKPVDVTHHGSTAMEYIASSLIEGGELKCKIAFEGGLITVGGAASTYTITFPDSGATVWSFSGFVQADAPATPLEDKMVSDVTVKVTGAITAS